VTGVAVRASGVVTGWGRGIEALPGDARAAAGGRRVIEAMPTPRTGDRLRRATRECLLAVDAVDLLLEDGRLPRTAIAGDGTALVYVTAAAYGASNRAFVEGGGRALHFPYTAPSAVPAEVAIEFGVHGPYAVLIGGAATTIDALDHARTLLTRGACARAIVLAVETFAECADLHARARWLVAGPLVEAAAAVLLEPTDAGAVGRSAHGEPDGENMASGWCPPNTIGESLACGPLIALALARAGAGQDVTVRGRWRGRDATLTLGVTAAARA
jgi:hypothetical protein